MSDTRKNGQTSNIIRLKLIKGATGLGYTGLTFSSTGLVISTIADLEATPTTYTAAGSTIETITTLGTFAAPTATKCRFKEVDATNHKGLYEFQFTDARFAVSSAKKLVISVSGVPDMLETDYEIQLVSFDPNDTVRLGLTALPNAAAEAAGGLYTRGTGAGQIAQDANGNVRVNVDTIKTQTVTLSGGVTIPAATLASTTNITAGTVTTATNVTTVNGLAAGVITAASIAADAITDAKVAADVTIASVTGSVGSVTGNVGGNVVGSVASVTAGVTLAASAVQAIWDALTSALTTVGSIGKLLVDNINATISSRSTYAGADTAGTTTLLTRIVGTLAAGTHNPQSGDAFARLGAPAGASVSADVASIKTDTGTTIPGRLPATLVGGRMDASVGAVAANAITAAGIADGAIDRATFAADTGMQTTRSATAQAGSTSTTLVLDAGASATTDFYLGEWMMLTGGTGAGQTRLCTAYNGTTKTATVAPAWAVTPDGTSTFAVIGVAGIGSLSATERTAIADALRTRVLTEGYAALGAAPTLEQALMMCLQLLSDFGITSTTKTTRKLDGATTAMTHTLNSSTAPTSVTRAS